MSPQRDLAGRSVLVHSVRPSSTGRLHSLVQRGARVTVLCAQPDAALSDIAGRGLIGVVADADPLEFDLVIRDGDPAPEGLGHHSGEPGSTTGRVTLVGGGPGDVGLLTLAGMQAIRSADVIVCDRLAPLAALEEAREDAEIIHVGKIPRGEFTPQERINEILIEKARAGLDVVRFKGGDSFVFGRGGEEWIACAAANVPVSIVPGISSSIAAAELAGIPVTHRSITAGFTVVSGHVAPSDPRNTVNWAALATSGLTIVVLMGVAALGEIAATLEAAGLPASTPVACIADASTPSQRAAYGRLDDIARITEKAGISAPAVTVIGEVVQALPRSAEHEAGAGG
ncbi:uroporphyrinogen-III C-methyltransferase [Cumulibacter manganitolerans]|uniref:uroporphyrinogen-III C-methyltransferase n=1 Tax=Cumulibacter manganitolerans TaxID=1884992 RepID=UPI0012976503|nr:uroporphyrinogen-III C-methyltransferase [Cumulibacter manganitolerans]